MAHVRFLGNAHVALMAQPVELPSFVGSSPVQILLWIFLLYYSSMVRALPVLLHKQQVTRNTQLLVVCAQKEHPLMNK